MEQNTVATNASPTDCAGDGGQSAGDTPRRSARRAGGASPRSAALAARSARPDAVRRTDACGASGTVRVPGRARQARSSTWLGRAAAILPNAALKQARPRHKRGLASAGGTTPWPAPAEPRHGQRRRNLLAPGNSGAAAGGRCKHNGCFGGDGPFGDFPFPNGEMLNQRPENNGQ
eukprot:gene105-biopygen19561